MVEKLEREYPTKLLKDEDGNVWVVIDNVHADMLDGVKRICLGKVTDRMQKIKYANGEMRDYRTVE